MFQGKRGRKFGLAEAKPEARRRANERERAWDDYVRFGGVDRLLYAWSFDHPAESARLGAVTKLFRAISRR